MFTLVRQQGHSVDGKIKDLNQFQIGFEGVLVGYLPFGEKVQIQPLFNFPHDELNVDALASIALQAAEVQGHSVEIIKPEEHSRRFYKDALAAMEADSDE